MQKPNLPFPARVCILALVVLTAGCGGERGMEPTTLAAANATTETEASTTGGGDLSFALASEATLDLPVTFCAGGGAIYTLVAQVGGTQVDLRIVENPVMRDGASLEQSTQASMRRDGSENGRNYVENWASTEVTRVSRDGAQTRIAGRMQGQRMYANGDGSFSSPVPIDQAVERNFSLLASCAR